GPTPRGRVRRPSVRHERPYLHRASPGDRYALRELDRLVEVLAVGEEVTAEDFLRLDERPVRDERLAVTSADNARVCRIPELEPGRLDALLLRPREERVPARQHLFPLSLPLLHRLPVPLVPLLGVVVEQKEVLHAAASSRTGRMSFTQATAASARRSASLSK